jgi:hypothetical protein
LVACKTADLSLFLWSSVLGIDVSHDEVHMPSAKEQIAKILQDQPDDSSYDELLRELAFARMIEQGLDDSDVKRTITHEEMGRRIKTWSS